MNAPTTATAGRTDLDARLTRLERQNRLLRGGLLLVIGAAVGAVTVGLGQPAAEDISPVVGLAIHSEDDQLYRVRQDGTIERVSLQVRTPGARNRLDWQVIGQ